MAWKTNLLVLQTEKPAAWQRSSSAKPRVLNCLCGHRDRLGYALRLRQGLPIGSGLIGGRASS